MNYLSSNRRKVDNETGFALSHGRQGSLHDIQCAEDVGLELFLDFSRTTWALAMQPL